MRQASRVLLLNPSLRDYYHRLNVASAISYSPPLNLALLASALLARGQHVEVLDLNAEPRCEHALAARLRTHPPTLVGLSIRTPLLGEACRLARRIKRLVPGVRLVAGGVHSSVRPQDVLRDAFDVAVINEGEETICDLAEGLPLDRIPGLAYLDERGGMVRTQARARLHDPDLLPKPAWHLFDIKAYSRRSLVAPHPPVADLESSRGCPSHCIYCTRSVLGARFRAKSPERFVEEVRETLTAGFKSFNLVDDCFTTDLERAIAICELLIRRGVKVPWTLTNGIRVSHCNDQFFKIAAASGLELVAFGLETGSQALLDRVGKGTTLEQARRAVASARAHGITTLGYFMVGLPGEDANSLQKTLDFARELELDFAKFSVTVPLPGTRLYADWQARIDPEHFERLNIHRNNRDLFSHPELSWEQIETFLQHAYRSFYLRPSYLVRRLRNDVRKGNLLFSLRTAMAIRW